MSPVKYLLQRFDSVLIISMDLEWMEWILENRSIDSNVQLTEYLNFSFNMQEMINNYH